ncbi:DUF6 domain protein, putative [Cordyceps militaris CM01]|uniref:DUF6 domain protein, putative n=2 Tax=Cordyceps militaris TaxID=73501 RepID=G3J321_CORMM|nr:DUF6 domain protein, putative [Cordyceps militaris CM01]ATY65760.1 DUF6 domain [Cordyceps militaris]EGX95604.1 DUF6 domain protein, putative [Cordyceps militaris CM01]
MARPNEGIYGTPLLAKPDDTVAGISAAERGRSNGTLTPNRAAVPAITSGARPALSRRSTAMRSRSPRGFAAEQAARKKYTYAAFFLVVSLVAFCLQTELSAYIQHDLGWDKAYCMMYFTHSSWVVLWPTQLLILRLQKLDQPWPVFWRRHTQLLKTTALMVEMQTLDVFGTTLQYSARSVRYMLRVTAVVTSALTVAGLSWYIAVSMTTPSDLTAIYNCSAFFAYAFSVPLLREPLRLDKSVAVLIAIIGVLVVAYGDTGSSAADGSAGTSSSSGPDASAESRFLGNMVIGFGSVLYGLYEVMYKRFACPPDGVSPGRGMIFANTFGSLIGLFTLTVLWLPLPLLHMLGWETFALPDAATGRLVLLAVLCNAVFSGSFLVLISLTSPVLSSVAALLTIFIVALADWALTGQPLSAAAMLGGSMIVLAFLALSWSTYREMTEHEAQKLAVDLTDSDDEDGNLSGSDS